jgi:acyl-coenzyme A thioesterase PaaI-like protein
MMVTRTRRSCQLRLSSSRDRTMRPGKVSVMTDAPGADPFHRRGPLGWDGGVAFGPYIDAVREVQDLVGGTNPPADVLERARVQLGELADLLRPYRCGEADLIPGRRHDLPGRGHPLLPPVVYSEGSDLVLRGQVRLSQYYLGGNGAAHGGTLPLLFDEVLGHLCNADGRAIARTAYLTVNYRAITPLDVDLEVEATLDREEGRKRYISGRLTRGGELLADANGLFIVLRPGQP